MNIGKWLFKKFGHLLPPDYGIFEKGSFPTLRKLNLKRAKSLILDGGQENRWEQETDLNVAFLKEHFFKKHEAPQTYIHNISRVFGGAESSEAEEKVYSSAGLRLRSSAKVDQNEELLICDYGTGIGRLSLPILKEFPKAKIVAVDESESLLELAYQWIPQVYFEEKRIEFLKPVDFFKKYNSEKAFDLLMVVYVFQHIYFEELNKLIPALRNLLKDDAKLFVVNTFKNDDPDGREIRMKDILEKYFAKEIEISPYENKDKYLEWMRFAGYGDWQKMENAKPRCQKFMGIYKKK